MVDMIWKVSNCFCVWERESRETQREWSQIRKVMIPSLSDMTNRWLSIRVEVLGNIIIFFSGLFAFYSRESIGAGLAALSISYAMQMIDGFGWTIRYQKTFTSRTIGQMWQMELEKEWVKSQL